MGNGWSIIRGGSGFLEIIIINFTSQLSFDLPFTSRLKYLVSFVFNLLSAYFVLLREKKKYGSLDKWVLIYLKSVIFISVLRWMRRKCRWKIWFGEGVYKKIFAGGGFDL